MARAKLGTTHSEETRAKMGAAIRAAKAKKRLARWVGSAGLHWGRAATLGHEARACNVYIMKNIDAYACVTA